MHILIIGLVAAFAVILLPKFIGRRQDRMLEQYKVLEKRFGLELRTTHSKWGKGIGEHHSLSGSFRGYPISLYVHYHGERKERIHWTSLVFETPFVGPLELRAHFSGTEVNARFSEIESKGKWEETGYALSASDEKVLSFLAEDKIRDRLEMMSLRPGYGAISLSKGFLEYRECGYVESDEDRARFQTGLLLLADVADALSVYASRTLAVSRDEL